MMTLVVLVVVAAVALFWGVGIYNGLITARNAFKNAFAQIDVQLKRRYELIPNLVETAKGYMAHEKQTLEAVIAARNAAQSALQAAAQDPASADKMRAFAGAELSLRLVRDGLIGLRYGKRIDRHGLPPGRHARRRDSAAAAAQKLAQYLIAVAARGQAQHERAGVTQTENEHG